LQICGRFFSQSELEWIRCQVANDPELNRVALSQGFCRHVGWRKPDGGLKEMSCRVALLRLERTGVIRLPAPRARNNPAGRVKRTAQGEPRPKLNLDAGKLELVFEPVKKKTSALWNELIDRYHYLGYRRLGGAQMRFFVRGGQKLLALLGFSAAAWRVAPRDTFIGWSEPQRKANLQRVVNNSRFLILPWVESKNLASRILSQAARRLPVFWAERYGYRPVLLETFVDRQRFNGTCYCAANWLCVGQTQGRGKWDTRFLRDQPVKSVFLYGLERRFKEALCR